MDIQSRNKWNNAYAHAVIGQSKPARVLTENAHLLPNGGRALDFACGLAANGIFLAERGFEVDAWDISDTVANKINDYAQQHHLALRGCPCDVNSEIPVPRSYDVIVVAHFLERSVFDSLKNALKPGGLLFYQTFSKDVTSSYAGPTNPAFRLSANELMRTFSDFRIVVYREEGLFGNVAAGSRNLVYMVASRWL